MRTLLLTRVGSCCVAGDLILKPRDAVGSLSQMNPAVLASLGLTLALVTAAIEAVVQPMRVYCALFSEQTRWLTPSANEK